MAECLMNVTTLHNYHATAFKKVIFGIIYFLFHNVNKLCFMIYCIYRKQISKTFRLNFTVKISTIIFLGHCTLLLSVCTI